MAGLEITLLLLAASCVLQVLARRWTLPHPVLLVLGGAVLAAIPGLPRVPIDPELIFVIFVPPLLFWTAVTTSLREFSAEFWPIVRLGVLLVLVSIGAVALTAHALTPAFTWPAAFALAAIVAPPDPVAATAVMRPLGAPPALVSILEGEGLVDDATALVSYRMAVAAAVTGAFSPWHAAGKLVLAGAGGLAIGLAVGWLIAWVREHLRGVPVIENTVALITPFASYLPADAVGTSGVLAVLATGLYLGRQGPRSGGAATRVQAEATWSMLAFILESLIFILVGLELPDAIASLRGHSVTGMLLDALVVSGVLIVLRLLWVWPSAYLPAIVARKLDPARRPPPWRWVLFVGWAGMRGADSLVIALALPLTLGSGAPFPARDYIIFVTFGVIFSTLVLQGLTLRPLLTRLGLADSQEGEDEEWHARRVITQAGLHRLEAMASQGDVDRAVFESLRHRQQRRLEQWAARDLAAHGHTDPEHRGLKRLDAEAIERAATRYREAHGEMIQAERQALVDLRDRGVIGDDVMRLVERDLDLETMLLEAGEDEAPDSPYEAY